MANLQAEAGWPDNFSGIVRLFPLPNLVVFPNVVQPLHIFEPRYCQMLEDALKHDRLIAMALLESGWEQQYLNNPPIANTVCVGKIVSHTPTGDSRHNILLVGIKRARIIRELKNDGPFRQAEVEVLTDVYPNEEAAERPKITAMLQDVFAELVPEGLISQASFQQLMGKPMPLGNLTDTIAYALNMPLAIKQQLLAEPNVDIRCRLLIRCLKQKLDAQSSSCESDEGFPPPFSTN